MSFKFEGSSYVVVTGVTSGFGLAVCGEVLKVVGDGSTIVMVGRNEDRMSGAVAKIRAACGGRKVDIVKVVYDLSHLAGIPEAVNQCFPDSDISNHDNFFLFNNAATLGGTDPVADVLDHRKVSDYFNLNVSSCLLFTSNVLNKISKQDVRNKYLVNVSSLFAVQPQSGCGLYCAGKAARDMLFKVISGENPELRVLNWSPGPMPTKMLDECAENKVGGESTEYVRKLIREGRCVPCEESAVKMLKLLSGGEFENGAHIDVYDV